MPPGRTLRRGGEGFLREWEPSWSADHFSRRAFRNRVYWAWRAREEGRALALFLIRRADARLHGGDHPRQHPPRAVAVGPGRLLDRAGLRAPGPDERGAGGGGAPRLQRARPQPHRGRLPAGERRLPRAARAVRLHATRAWPRATCRSAAAGATMCSTPSCAPTGAIRPGRTVGRSVTLLACGHRLDAA